MAVPVNDILAHPAPGLAEQVHGEATRVDVADATRELGNLLTDRLLAYIVNVRDVKTLARWESGRVSGMRVESERRLRYARRVRRARRRQVSGVRVESERRLRTAYEIATLLGRVEAASTIRAWFIGMDPYLDDASPADAIHDGRLQDALNAARSFIAYGGMGS